MTSDSKGRQEGQRQRFVKLLVVAVVAGALVFGGYVGYLVWVNDSFPAQQRPFSEYATITTSTFNGTEYSFTIKWLRSDTVPLFAQLTSTSTDAANTPVCDIGLNSTQAGQESFMPFAISQHLAALSSVELSIAMKSSVNGSEFTIVYDVSTVTANPGNILPSNVSCSQPMGFE